MAERYYVGKAHWLSIVHAWLEDYFILATLQDGENLYFAPLQSETVTQVVYDQARPVQPLKTYMLPPLELVSGDQSPQEKPWLFLGVKACDLSALAILDPAFGGDFADPHYEQRRHSSLLVSSDCTVPLPSCFCKLVGGSPYPQKGFDLNLSKIWDGFVVEVGSLKGRQLLEGHEAALKDLVKEEAETLLRIRRETEGKLELANKAFSFSGPNVRLSEEQWEADAWAEHVKTCVECGACNFVCPTCHCYFLDDVTQEAFAKLRGWDSCQYTGYAMTAGGGTPRPALVERFRNRYYCKFNYLPANYSHSGCTGCGRCVDACQGKIDMRQVLTDLPSNTGGAS